ncbi:cobyrinic acid a,c-diamide synthase [Solemya pervernicosa gill symbiont]|uniref:Cobyrinic acid a,c-diamide synthase n=1 Tax=Solemya pervernicosa gill symbiont TaxID=642797 RepID=A0A1T2LAV2_9GAMM|nr:cobyrinic acid a,c-diamide synthase [Solemya pervernicosa gill symbiont]
MPDRGRDQADGLRKMSRPRPVKVIAVTGGKGGVGKTSLSVNLGISLAESGREVLLLDADLGLANVDVLLGVHAPYNLSHVISGERTLEEVIVEGPGGMKIIPASSGTQKMAELTPAEHAGLIRAFSELSFSPDVLLIDTAAGISDNVISFTRAAQEVMVVVCDEPASITDAYAIMKVLNRDYDVSRFHVMANMTHSSQEGRELFAKMTMVADRFLDVTLNFIGAVPYDDHIRKAVRSQRPVVLAYPRSRAAQAFRTIAQKVDGWPSASGASGHLEFFFERLIHSGPSDAELMP